MTHGLSGNTVIETGRENPLPVTFAHGLDAMKDAFGRLRVSEVATQLDSFLARSGRDDIWETRITGGATVTYDQDKKECDLALSTAAGDEAIRQTRRYWTYIPGKGMVMECTGKFNPAQAGLLQEIMYGDASNGLGFQIDGDTDLGVFIRSDVSGSVVDSPPVRQTEWNLDNLDGSKNQRNPSGLILDITKAQIFGISFQYLSVGSVVFSLNIGGINIPIHHIDHANIIGNAYMGSPNLPVRYRLKNTGSVVAVSTLTEICATVYAEGAFIPPIEVFDFGKGVTTTSITTRVPILAVRLFNQFDGIDNRRKVQFVDSKFYSKDRDVFFEVFHDSGPTIEDGTSAAVSSGCSGCEFFSDVTSVTPGIQNRIASQYVPAGASSNIQGASSDMGAGFGLLNEILTQNFESNSSEGFIVYATSMDGMATEVSAELKIGEFD